MRKVTQFAFGLVLVMGLTAGLAQVSASCGGARAVTSSTSVLTSFSTPGNPFSPGNYPTTPYGGSATYYINGVFWSFGGGNPAYGVGNDSGYFKAYSPVLAQVLSIPTWLGGGYVGGFGLFIGGPFGHWQIPGVDGCIDADGANTSIDAAECNVVLLTDEANGTGYFSALSVNPGAGGDFVYNTTTGFPGSVTLAPIPKPTVITSTTVGSTINVTATVNPGAVAPANGFDFKCHANELLTGYKIYVRSFPGHNTPKPIQVNTREINQSFGPPLAPWVPVTPAAGLAIGQNASFSLNCSAGGDTDYYLCSTLLFGGTAVGAAKYELKNCSMNSTKIECGPNMANPEPSQIRRIERGSDTATPKKPGTRSGR